MRIKCRGKGDVCTNCPSCFSSDSNSSKTRPKMTCPRVGVIIVVGDDDDDEDDEAEALIIKGDDVIVEVVTEEAAVPAAAAAAATVTAVLRKVCGSGTATTAGTGTKN